MRDTIDMAREAGLIVNSPYLMPHDHALQGIKAFEALVRADALANIDPTGFMSYQEADAAGRFAEREACWRLCDALWIEGKDAHDCREAIRARGNT